MALGSAPRLDQRGVGISAFQRSRTPKSARGVGLGLSGAERQAAASLDGNVNEEFCAGNGLPRDLNRTLGHGQAQSEPVFLSNLWGLGRGSVLPTENLCPAGFVDAKVNRPRRCADLLRRRLLGIFRFPVVKVQLLYSGSKNTVHVIQAFGKPLVLAGPIRLVRGVCIVKRG